MMEIFAAMMEMRHNALTDRREPLRWEINNAGLVALRCSEQIQNVYSDKPLIERPMFGIPMMLTDDRSDDPRVALIVKEGWLPFYRHDAAGSAPFP